MEKVTHLVLVTDASKKGCQVVKTIKNVADELVMYEKAGVIVNRIPDKKVIELMDISGLPLLSVIENDMNWQRQILRARIYLHFQMMTELLQGRQRHFAILV